MNDETISHHVVSEILTTPQYCSNNDPMPQHSITESCKSECKYQYLTGSQFLCNQQCHSNGKQYITLTKISDFPPKTPSL